jgi:hypothetical protein
MFMHAKSQMHVDIYITKKLYIYVNYNVRFALVCFRHQGNFYYYECS